MTRALVMLGGGSRGAYQVGVVSHLIGEKLIDYRILCGVSVGALNAGMLAMFGRDKHRDAVASLMHVWREIKPESIRKKWGYLGLLHAFWRPSLYDSSPLIDLVRDRMSAQAIRSSGNRLSVLAVSLTTGEHRMFDEMHPSIVDAILASSSFPAMFKPIEIDGQLWTDGGLRNESILKHAIAAGATDIDVVITAPKTQAIPFKDKPNVIDVATRAIDVLGDSIAEYDVRMTLMVNTLVAQGIENKRYVNVRVFRPSERLPARSLDFDPKAIRTMIEMGRDDASSVR